MSTLYLVEWESLGFKSCSLYVCEFVQAFEELVYFWVLKNGTGLACVGESDDELRKLLLEVLEWTDKYSLASNCINYVYST